MRGLVCVHRGCAARCTGVSVVQPGPTPLKQDVALVTNLKAEIYFVFCVFTSVLRIIWAHFEHAT